ncbi:hypothetical protein IFR05_012070 [Cadophora sp. M221]|nr:hypothetical protein IFR05_012070 [Cadophora sp. M221]
MALLEMQWFLQRVMGMASAADELEDSEYHFLDNREFDEDEGDISNLGLDEEKVEYDYTSSIEETSDHEVRAQFNTNVFGPLSVIRSVLPFMRAKRSGVIANIGSLGGYASFAGSGYYCSSKFALAGLTESLRAEVGPLGIQATVIEPVYFRTSLLQADIDGKTVAAASIDAYKSTMERVKGQMDSYDGKQPGDPALGAQIIVEALTGTGRAAGKTLPARLLLGSDSVPFVAIILERQNKEVDEWKGLVVTTDHAQ